VAAKQTFKLMHHDERDESAWVEAASSGLYKVGKKCRLYMLCPSGSTLLCHGHCSSRPTVRQSIELNRDAEVFRLRHGI
jgi:hypothetical protein